MLMMSLADKSVAEVRFELTSAGVANPVHSLVELDWLPTVQSVSLSLINIRSFAQIIHQVWAGMKDKQQNRAKGMFARLTNQQHRERTILINFQSITLHIQVFRNNCETCKSFFLMLFKAGSCYMFLVEAIWILCHDGGFLMWRQLYGLIERHWSIDPHSPTQYVKAELY